MIKYREDQIDIINYDSKKMAIQAVPGAGKTFIITNLVSKLIKEKKINSSKVLIVTYMNSGVNNFKNRIKVLLDDKKLNKTYDVMTIHSLAVKIIKEKPEILMLNEDFLILDDLQKNIILGKLINDYKEKNERVFEFFIKEIKNEEMKYIAYYQWNEDFFDLILSSISKLKYKDISSSKLEELLGKNYNGLLRIVLSIYKEYEQILKNQGFLDFDDILILAYKALLQDESLRNTFKDRYEYIFEDECQDSNEIQGKIIKLISNGNLVRVGDVNQSITGTFSMSDPRNFKDFMKEADYLYKMDMSNRSSKDILELANYLVNDICKNSDAFEKIVVKTVPEGYKPNPSPEKYQIYFNQSLLFEEEIENIIKTIKKIKTYHEDKSIGILVPFNRDIESVTKALQKEELEYEELGVNSFYKRKSIIYLSIIIDFLIHCDDVDKLILVLDEVLLDLENKNDVLEKLKDYTTEEIIYGNFYDERLDKAIKTIRDILDFPVVNVEKLILHIKNKLNLEKEDNAILDYLAFYFKYMLEEDVNLIKLYELISDTKNRSFSRVIETFYESEGYEVKEGVISVCNYHKSKGLEWDCVFLVGMNNFNFPDMFTKKISSEKWYLKDKYKNPTAVIKYEMDRVIDNKNISLDLYFYQDKKDIINEKLRLLYVGITRAKEMIVFSFSKYKSKEDIENKRKPNEISKYMICLLEKMKENRR